MCLYGNKNFWDIYVIINPLMIMKTIVITTIVHHLNLAILVDLYLVEVLICISPVTNCTEHSFTCLLASCMFSLVECYFKHFAHLFWGFFLIETEFIEGLNILRILVHCWYMYLNILSNLMIAFSLL